MAFATVAEYLAAQPPPVRAALTRVRAAIKKALPRATEGISYQMPVYKIDGAMVLYIAGYAKHWSIYPATPRLLAALKKELADHLHSKATLRFPIPGRVPSALVARIARLRAAEVAAARRPKRR